MSNFFSFDSNYNYEPVLKQVDLKSVDREIELIRRKIIESIKIVINQKDLSRSEIALATRISPAIAGKIYRGDPSKISTDRLLRMAKCLGLKVKIQLSSDA